LKEKTMHAISRWTISVLIMSGAFGCTSAQLVEEYGGGPLPRPDQILVYDFATSPDEVRLDRGLSARVVEAAKSEPRSEQERELGQKVARALSDHLIKALSDLGLPAERGSGEPPAFGNTVLIEGQFVSIDQGNRTARVVIGLGAGRSEVETHVQVYLAREGGNQALEKLDVSAKGSLKPGAAETLGVGAIAGNLVVAGAVTAAGTTASETLGGTVKADAKRTATKIVKELKPFFERQGWL
jgi:hypothetical protein